MQEIKAGKVEFRVDKAGQHPRAGRQDVVQRRRSSRRTPRALIDAVLRAKPAAAKGKYVKSAHVSSTMGPGIALDEAAIDAREA